MASLSGLALLSPEPPWGASQADEQGLLLKVPFVTVRVWPQTGATGNSCTSYHGALDIQCEGPIPTPPRCTSTGTCPGARPRAVTAPQVHDYMYLLRSAARAVNSAGRNGMMYLAAAVILPPHSLESCPLPPHLTPALSCSYAIPPMSPCHPHCHFHA